MSAISFGVRNLTRNPARTTAAVLLVGLSVGFSLAMGATSADTRAQAGRLRAEIATLIEVNPAGQAGGGSGGRSLSGDVGALGAMPNVVRVERYIRRQFVNNQRKPALGVLVGVEPGATLRLSAMGGFIGSPKIIAGRTFSPQDNGKPVAIVGKAFADNLGLKVGSEFVLPAGELQRRNRPDPRIQDLRAKVVGVFQTRVLYGDNQIFVPLPLAQQALGLEGDAVSQYYLTAKAADHVPGVARAVKKALGNSADVVSQDAAATSAARAFEVVSVNSRWGGIISAIAGALVIFLTMFLILRERTREIGILKAVGASDGNVARLFAAETAALAALGGILGMALYLGVGEIFARIVFGRLGPGGGVALRGALSGAEFVYGMGLTVLFALAGGAYPVVRAVRMRPAAAVRER